MNRFMKGWRKQGFTLIEMLLTMAISSVLLVTLAALVVQGTKGHAMSQRAIDQISEARAFIQLLEHELSTRLPDSPIIYDKDKPDRIAWFRVISPHEENTDDPGDLSMIAYYMHDLATPDGKVQPKLFRKCIGPKLTQQILENEEHASFPEPEPTEDEIVLEQALGFSMTPYYYDPSTQRMEPWSGSNQPPVKMLVMKFKLADETLTKKYSNGNDWRRIAESPSPEEMPYIRTFAHTFHLTR